MVPLYHSRADLIWPVGPWVVLLFHTLCIFDQNCLADLSPVYTQITCTTRINWRHITVLRTNTIIYNASLHSMELKGVWHEIFVFRFFHKSVSLGPLNIPIGPFQIFSKIRGDIREWMFISDVNDTGEKREKFWDKIFKNILLRA